MKIYRIRNKKTGLFAGTGWGSNVEFTRKGRVFSGLNFLKSHLQSMWTKRADIYSGCEVIEYEVVEKQVIDIHSLIEK